MSCEQLYQSIRKGRAEHVGYKDARSGPAGQQATLLQVRYRLAQRRARHPKPFGQVAL